MLYLLPLLILLFSCSDSSSSNTTPQRGEYIKRKHHEFAYVPPQQLTPRAPYPWEKPLVGNQSFITKEFFRCKGSSLNPVRIYNQNGESTRFYDCGGSEKHSLPLRDGKEFIYPILLELVNYIQAQTGKRVVITCGHRCPEHNTYADPAKSNQSSKHMIGAEVALYVQGLEHDPQKVVTVIQNYYKQKYKETAFTQFERYTKNDSNTSIAPWYNKEIFVKLFKANEGRDSDNRHPYPYVSIQVRYDLSSQSKVIYNWNEAYKNYLRK